VCIRHTITLETNTRHLFSQITLGIPPMGIQVKGRRQAYITQPNQLHFNPAMGSCHLVKMLRFNPAMGSCHLVKMLRSNKLQRANKFPKTAKEMKVYTSKTALMQPSFSGLFVI
jgi:hypothetical protein